MKGLSTAIELVEKGLIPDWLIRKGIRKLLEQRLEESRTEPAGTEQSRIDEFVGELVTSSIALHPEKANEQHYEVPPEFFLKVLGPRLKYSSCLWSEGVNDLAAAEEAMLRTTCDRADLEDGQSILELGCGWGSMTLWMAEHFPNASILAMSNSAPQRRFILERAAAKGLRNVEVITCDINDFQPNAGFDRVVSIEMFEHVRNYRELMRRISTWLTPDGKLFVHIFCHRNFAYPFETEGADNWMGRHFFTGGIMPSKDLLLRFQDHLELDSQWEINGSHYSRTACAWLDNLDRNRDSLDPVLAHTYGSDEADRWRIRWRLFFMACEELFGYRNGEEWMVAHYRFRKRP